MNTSIEITKEEATARLNNEVITGERFYDTNIQLANGNFEIATLQNIAFGVKFHIVK